MKQYRNEYKCVSETKHQIPDINTISELRTFKIRIIFSLLFILFYYIYGIWNCRKCKLMKFFFLIGLTGKSVVFLFCFCGGNVTCSPNQ